MGRTFAEKVLSRAAGKELSAGEIAVVQPDFCMSHENGAAVAKAFQQIGSRTVYDRERIVLVFDHTVPASTAAYANTQAALRAFAKEQEITHFYDLNSCGGICHQIMVQEGYAMPGTVVIGTDSHTCTSGALGAFATGIGRTEMAAVWACGDIWLRVPESIKIEVSGRFRPGVSAKDFVLTVIGDFGADGADYQSVEYHGKAILDMSLAERMTICNMGIEMGAKNVVCQPDETLTAQVAPRAKTHQWQEIWADPDAPYSRVLHYDLDAIVPSLACPHTVDRWAPVAEYQGLEVQQVFIGSCTNGRFEDLRAAAEILRGRNVAVRTLVTPASVEEYQKALESGVIQDLLRAGCTVSHPSCGPCAGVMGGLLADGEVCVATSNRNFLGRMGNRNASVYLASPMTAAYTALTGRLGDPRTFFERC